MTDPLAVDEPTARPLHPPSKLTPIGPVLIGCFIGLVVCTNVANAVFANWVTQRPEQLLMLSSRNRYVALTAIDGMHWWTWAGIATLRLGAAATVCHLIGRVYGDQALRWFWKFMGMSQDGVRQFERQFSIAELVLVPLFVGSNIVFVLSGAARSSWKKLVPLFLLGVAGRLALIWWLAHEFESQLRDIIDLLTKYQWPIIIVSIAVVVLVNLNNFRKGR